MADMFIETQIDQLAKLVIEKKKIPVSEAAKILKTTETQVEGWVRILEESGFVVLAYPALGEPIIILKKVEADAANKKKKEIEEKREAVEDKAKDYQKKIETIEKKVEINSKEFSKLESELRPKIKELEKNLKILDTLEDKRKQMTKQSDEIKNVADCVNREVENIRGDIHKMEDQINEHLKEIEGHELSIKSLDESKKTIEEEIAGLESEIRMVRLFLKGPSIEPMKRLRNIFARHAQKTEKVSEKRKELHKKVLSLKTAVSKKKESKQKGANKASGQFGYTIKY
jgi:chromosome segregation ATPase